MLNSNEAYGRFILLSARIAISQVSLDLSKKALHWVKKNCPVLTEQLFIEFGNLTGLAVISIALFILLKTF